MPKKLTRRELNVKKKSVLRKQSLKVNPRTFGVKSTWEVLNKPVLDALASQLEAAK